MCVPVIPILFVQAMQKYTKGELFEFEHMWRPRSLLCTYYLTLAQK